MRKIAAFIIAVCMVGTTYSAGAAETNPPDGGTAEPKLGSPGAGVQWTKIQDISPGGRATNRPIKQKYAVVVGVGKFRESRLNDEDVVSDKAAREFYDYLVDPHSGRFEKNNVRLLVNTQATRANVMSTLGESWLGPQAGPDDLVIVFIATKSFPTTDGSSYLCAYDCQLDNVYATCIDIPSLMSTLKKNVKTDRIVLVLQACYSGAAELTSGAKALFSAYNFDFDKLREKLIMGKGFTILSSSQPNERTWDDTFSSSLITALREQNGMVPLNDAFAKAREMTEYKSSHFSKGGKKQTPLMKTDWKGNDLCLGMPPLERVASVPTGVLNYLSAEAHYLKANNLVAEKKFDEALKEYEIAVATDPKYADALCDYGAILAMKGDWQAAAEKFAKAIEARPSDSLFHKNYARALSQLGKKDDCLRELEKAYELNPKDKDVLIALAARSREANEPITAVRYLQEAVTLYPASPSLHDKLSYALAQAGDVSQACDHAREAVKLDPESSTYKLNLGATLLMQGDSKAAVDAYREASTLNPQSPDVHYGLAKALEKSGDRKAASQELSRFLELAPASDARRAKATQHLSELER